MNLLNIKGQINYNSQKITNNLRSLLSIFKFINMLLKNGKIFYKGKFADLDIEIDDETGKILKIERIDEISAGNKGGKILNLSKKLIIPGAIDAHVHFRDFEQAYKEDFLSGSKAAVNGGITRVFEMPNSKPKADCLRVIASKIKKNPDIVNMHFYGGVSDEDFENNAKQIEKFIVCYKFYMYEDKNFVALEKLNKKISFHAELNNKDDSVRNEINAVSHIAEISDKFKFKPHICHISTSEGLKIAKEKNWTVEVTPHNLLLDKSKDIRFNVRPPLRDERERMKLVRNLNAIDVIASDHAPHSEKEKENGANGFSGIETLLPLMLNLVNKGVLTLEQLIEKICINPAKIFEMNNEILLNEKANLTVIDLKKEWKIKGDNFYSKSKFTPFEGWKVIGKATDVVVNGRLVMEDEILNV